MYFIIPCINRNTCQYYNTERYELIKSEMRWRMLRDYVIATVKPKHLRSLSGFPGAHVG